MLAGALFDMDGLMFDSEPIWTETWAPALKKNGIDEVPEGLPDACRGTAGVYEVKMVRQYLGQDVDAEKIVDDFQDLGTRYMMENGVPKKPGLDRLLACLKDHGVPMAVASSSRIELIRSNLAHAGIEDYFSVLVSGNAIAHPKPAPDVFLMTAEKLGVEPARSLVLEDSPNGIRAAHAGGFIPVMVPDTVQPDEEIRSLAKAVCHTLGDVADLLEQGRLG